jgi:hypothetical protein
MILNSHPGMVLRAEKLSRNSILDFMSKFSFCTHAVMAMKENKFIPVSLVWVANSVSRLPFLVLFLHVVNETGHTANMSK